jgi:hypothetical protein
MMFTMTGLLTLAFAHHFGLIPPLRLPASARRSSIRSRHVSRGWRRAAGMDSPSRYFDGRECGHVLRPCSRR